MDELGHGSKREAAERTSPFRDLVHHFLQLFILPLQEFVQVIELRSENIPMIVSRFCVKKVFIRKQSIEYTDNAFTLFV